VPTCQNGYAGGCTGWLRVHPGENNALFTHLVYLRRFITEVLLQTGKAYCTERGVVPEDINDVRRPAVFFPKIGKLGVNLLVLGRLQIAPLVSYTQKGLLIELFFSSSKFLKFKRNFSLFFLSRPIQKPDFLFLKLYASHLRRCSKNPCPQMS
jgi:hypothetical protein